MRCTILEFVFGVLAVGPDGEIIDYILFPKNPVEIADKLDRLGRGKVLDEAVKLVKRLRDKGVKSFVFEHEEIARQMRESLNIDATVEGPSELGRLYRRALSSKAVELGFAESREEYLRIVQKSLDLLARKAIKERSGRGDVYVVQAVHALDEIDKSINLFYSRLREWYGLYFSELNDAVDDPEEYFKVVAEIGWREDMDEENLLKIGLKRKTVERVLDALKTSIAADIDERDLEEIRKVASVCLNLFKLRKGLEKYIGKRVQSISPNLHALAGPIIAAKLIAQAGSLEALSKMPSSTVQVLGAEKALFRALRTGTRPPKHGIIFQHPIVRQSPRRLRGRVSRVLAAKLAIAARIDSFTGRDVSSKLKEDLEQRVQEVLQQTKSS